MTISFFHLALERNRSRLINHNLFFSSVSWTGLQALHCPSEADFFAYFGLEFTSVVSFLHFEETTINANQVRTNFDPVFKVDNSGLCDVISIEEYQGEANHESDVSNNLHL